MGAGSHLFVHYSSPGGLSQSFAHSKCLRNYSESIKHQCFQLTFCFGFFFFFFIYFYQLEANYFTILQWFLSYIDMNQPWIYMYSPSRSPLPPPSLPNSSGSSQCTRPEHVSHASNLGWGSVSLQIIYTFRCCSLETSHPLFNRPAWVWYSVMRIDSEPRPKQRLHGKAESAHLARAYPVSELHQFRIFLQFQYH